jgi:hypothetical protein
MGGGNSPCDSPITVLSIQETDIGFAACGTVVVVVVAAAAAAAAAAGIGEAVVCGLKLGAKIGGRGAEFSMMGV